MTISEHISFPRGFLGTFKIHIFNLLSASDKSKNLQKVTFLFIYLFSPVSKNIYLFH